VGQTEMNILFVDDNAQDRLIVARWAEKWGKKIDVLDSPEKLLKQLDGGVPMDVILLDWLMPTYTGLELCERIKSKRKNCYIIIVSSIQDEDAVVRALEAGADDFVHKPLHHSVLKKKIENGIQQLDAKKKTHIPWVVDPLNTEKLLELSYDIINRTIDTIPILMHRVLVKLQSTIKSGHLFIILEHAVQDAKSDIYYSIPDDPEKTHIKNCHVPAMSTRSDDRIQNLQTMSISPMIAEILNLKNLSGICVNFTTASSKTIYVGIANESSVAIEEAEVTYLSAIGEGLSKYTKSVESQVEQRELKYDLNLTLHHLDQGIWEWDLVTGNIQWSDHTSGTPELVYTCFADDMKLKYLGLHKDRVENLVQDHLNGQLATIEYEGLFELGPKEEWIKFRGRQVKVGGRNKIVGSYTIKTEQMSEIAVTIAAKKAIETTTNPIAFLDTDKKITYANSAFWRYVGMSSPFNPVPLSKVFLRIDHEDFESHEFSGKVHLPNGGTNYFTGRIDEIDSSVSRQFNEVLCLRDITSEILGRRKLIQSGSLEALGMLAGGIAHDFNNQLSIMKGFIDRTLSKFPNTDSLIENLGFVQNAVETTIGLTSKLLAFSRDTASPVEVININKILPPLISMLSHSLGPGIHIKMDSMDNLYDISIQPSDINAIMTNLAINARDEINGSGTISIEVKNEKFKGNSPAVKISVMDDGPGIPLRFLDRIFDPFFSTKPKDKGTGLGLSLVLDIVKSLGGTLEVATRPEFPGTRFDIWLPAISDTPNAEDAVPLKSPTPNLNGMNILIVEDNVLFCELIVDYLRKCNAKVTACHSCEEFQRNILNRTHIFDMVISDYLLPDGKSIDILQKFAPPKILMSAYMDSPNTLEEPWFENGIYLQKPFENSKLIQSILDLTEVVT
jgi:signal transduction histidine kinase/DNA-binding response OmpR family regulator